MKLSMYSPVFVRLLTYSYVTRANLRLGDFLVRFVLGLVGGAVELLGALDSVTVNIWNVRIGKEGTYFIRSPT